MHITSIATPLFHKGESLLHFILQAIAPLQDGNILAITSKLCSVAENRWVPAETREKADLIRAEATLDLGPLPFGARLTIIHGLLLPSAGIDASNVEGGGFLLYPKDPFSSAYALWRALREAYGITNLGIL